MLAYRPGAQYDFAEPSSAAQLPTISRREAVLTELFALG